MGQGETAACAVECVSDDQCPELEGDAPAFCFNGESCVLLCNQGQECPPGMECGGSLCGWP